MKKLYHLLSITFFVTLFSLSTTLFGQNPFGVTLIQPNTAGIEWVVGETYTISWTDNLSQPVEIYLYNPNIVIAGAVTTKWMELSVTSNPTGVTGSTWLWSISDTLTASSGYKIKVQSKISPLTYYDEGLEFDLVYAPANSITVLQPSVSGISWARGTSHLISWTDNINENVAIYLYNPNIVIAGAVTTKWMELSVTSDPAGISGTTWTWAISDTLTASAGYKVKVVSVDYSSVYDEGTETFSITAESGDFTEIYQPIATTSWPKSTTHLISWNDNIEGPVDVYYINNDVGTGVEEIATDVVGSTYAWTIPLLITGPNYNIVLKSSLDPSIEITSSNFEITQTLTGGITAIYQPLDNTSWTVGTTHLISWLDNLNEPVSVYYNNTPPYNDINDEEEVALNVQGTTVAWDIPSGLTTGDNKCKIIVRSTIDPTVVYLASDLFELSASSGSEVTVIQPSITGISWARGTSHYISWDNDFPENVTIDLLRYNSSDVLQQTTNLVDNTPGAEGSTWVWDIDGSTLVSDYYKIKIASINDPTSLVDESDEYFSITGSSGTFINTIEPSGGEFWMYGSAHWTSWNTNCPENVYIYLDQYTDDVAATFVSTVEIESATAGTTVGVSGSTYAWTINQVGIDTTLKFKYRVVSTDQASLYGSSADFFHIVPVGKSPTSNPNMDDIESSVTMYPNPTHGQFVVSSPVGISNVEVRNLFGQVIYSKEILEQEEVRIDMTNHDSGVYIVNVRINGKVITKKLFAY